MKHKLFAELARIAPNCRFSASRTLDPCCSWDGDGADPREQGFSAYDVTVTAETIINGEIVEGSASLGPSWYQPGEPLDDIHGYLPQMLEEAATELQGKVEHCSPLYFTLAHAITFLKNEMRRLYNEQQSLPQPQTDKA